MDSESILFDRTLQQILVLFNRTRNLNVDEEEEFYENIPESALGIEPFRVSNIESIQNRLGINLILIFY